MEQFVVNLVLQITTFRGLHLILSMRFVNKINVFAIMGSQQQLPPESVISITDTFVREMGVIRAPFFMKMIRGFGFVCQIYVAVRAEVEQKTSVSYENIMDPLSI